jgi:hypothetical protein
MQVHTIYGQLFCVLLNNIPCSNEDFHANNESSPFSMITGSQVRAARGLLDWSADTLAEKAKLNVDTIRNIEKGRVQGHGTSLDKIVQVFAKNRVEFTDNQGVRVRPTIVETYEGPERFDEFYDFLYEHMLEQCGEVCLSVVDEGLLAKYRTNPEVQRQRMRELVNSGKVSYRVLVTVGDFTGDYVEYRQQPARAAAPTAFYAFGECLALISFPGKAAPHVVVIRSQPLTDSYRQAFYAAWEKAKPVSVGNTNKHKKRKKK